jgi:hypothetical protein
LRKTEKAAGPLPGSVSAWVVLSHTQRHLLNTARTKDAKIAHKGGGHKQLISNGGRLKPAFDEKDKKHTTTDLRGISSNWF